jgi:hypothetical protein
MLQSKLSFAPISAAAAAVDKQLQATKWLEEHPSAAAAAAAATAPPKRGPGRPPKKREATAALLDEAADQTQLAMQKKARTKIHEEDDHLRLMDIQSSDDSKDERDTAAPVREPERRGTRMRKITQHHGYTLNSQQIAMTEDSEA